MSGATIAASRPTRNRPTSIVCVGSWNLIQDVLRCWSRPNGYRLNPLAEIAAALPECLGFHRNQVSVQTTSATTAQNGTDMAMAFAIPRAGRKD